AVADAEEKHGWEDFVPADGGLSITIADSGAGVAGEDSDALFHPGAWAKPEAGGEGRHGFGLVLVRQGGSRLGGHGDGDSDGGAIFTVTLPLGDAAAVGDYDSAQDPTTDEADLSQHEGLSQQRAEGAPRER